MVNRWTGAYDAVIEIAPSGVDQLLAAVHRKGDPIEGVPATGPHLLHSLALNLPIAGHATERDLRGHLQVQVSTPSVSVPDEAGQVSVSVVIHAWFQKSFGSDPAPEFVHGTLRFTTSVEVVECQGVSLAEVRVGTSDVAVDFTPASGSGLGAADAGLVEEVARAFLRGALRPVQLRISSLGSGDFLVRDLDFKTLRSGSRSALAVLLGFGAGAPAPAGVSEVFLGTGDDVALAIGRELVTSRLRELAQGPLSGIEVSGSRFFVSFRAAPDPASLRIELRPGRIRATLDGAGSLSPGGSFEFRLTQDFGLVVSGGELALTLAAEPQLAVTRGNFFLRRVFGLFKGRILDAIEVAASGVIQPANQELNRVVDRTVRDLLAELEVPGIGLALARAAIDPDAVILGGAFDIGPTRPVVASFTNIIRRPPGQPVFGGFDTELDALASWIPGGTIERYRWTEVRAGGGTGRRVTEEHRFVLRTQPRLATVAQSFGWPPYTWCLQVEGTQFVDALDPVSVSGAACGVSVVVPSLDLPRGAGRLVLHVGDGKGGVHADLDPWGHFRPHAFAERTENRGVLLVHHAGERPAEAARALREALVDDNEKLPIFPTLVTVAPDHGFACGAPHAELESFAVTNDPEGEWRKRFRLEPGTTVIVGPDSAELWRDAGPLRADVLGKVLRGLGLEEARSPRSIAVRLGMSLGAFAPELFLPCGGLGGVSMALTKLRGREVELCFWTTWSAASLEELRRGARAAHSDPDGPLRFCVNDGEDPELAAKFLARHELDLPLVPDPERKISRRYGVTCWPTVVRVDAEGRLAAARLGLELDTGPDSLEHTAPSA